MKILLVEDDLEISEMLRRYLTTENYQIVCAYDGEAACRQFEADSYDLVLLDLMIPKRSGLDVMQQMRRQSVVPIIILSAKDAESDKILGLGLGADDYITKPFSLTEVLARVQAILCRSTQWSAQGELDTAQERIHYGALHMNLAGQSILLYSAGAKICFGGQYGLYRTVCWTGQKISQSDSGILISAGIFDASQHRGLYAGK